jgi:hypothetical protein
VVALAGLDGFSFLDDSHDASLELDLQGAIETSGFERVEHLLQFVHVSLSFTAEARRNL